MISILSVKLTDPSERMLLVEFVKILIFLSFASLHESVDKLCDSISKGWSQQVLLQVYFFFENCVMMRVGPALRHQEPGTHSKILRVEVLAGFLH